MMIDGIGARALRYWESRQAVSANNLANVSTPGFKAERVFARLLSDASLVMESGTDFSSGALNPTGRPLDVALVGDGFLVVQTAEGPRWTRGGSLSLNSAGTLVDSGNHPVLGAHGEIVLPNGVVEINNSGGISVDGVSVDQLLLERPRTSVQLERAGGNLWLRSDEFEEVAEDQIQVRQGQLEDSNVNSIMAMVEMIEIQRAYSAVQRSIITADEVMHTITTEIGRVG